MPFLLPRDVKFNKDGINSKDLPGILKKYGGNGFSRKKRKTFFSQYLSSFGDPIIKILLIALALNIIISIYNADIYEPLGIAIALFLATFVSTLSEYAGESAFLKLEREWQDVTCRTIRDGKPMQIKVDDLVCGDTVFLSSGERVPADGIVFKGSITVDQAPINGESRDVQKRPAPPLEKWDLSDCAQVFRGSVVTSGECIMCVGRTGDNTFYGAVASEIQTESGKSPLTERLGALAGSLAKIGYIAALCVFVADLFSLVVMDNLFSLPSILSELKSLPQMVSNILHALTLSITVVVVAVPEGLPMMITTLLSSNMQRLKRDNVLVRRLVGIETGGSLNILFCDKTGTLTKGRLSVIGFYDINGEFFKKVPQQSKADVFHCSVLTSDCVMSGSKAMGGNATDRACVQFAFDKGLTKPEPIDKIPFDSAKKYSAAKTGGVWYVKGAPEVILAKCTAPPAAFLQKLNSLTKDGVRVIALAKSTDMISYQLVGMLAISDVLRPDAVRSVKTIKGAGIHVCMVTGDNVDTARKIAKDCGIADKNLLVLTSAQLAELTDAELAASLCRLCVVARALPSDKSRLVRVAKSAGLVCGMTGDGVNDAPALKQADVGFAMGSGTEVAKQAGDIIVLDDNITSIAKAILYGRTIFKSIRKFIVFQLTMNLCAVGISVIGPFIGTDTPVTVMQMLWLNIIMDTLAGLAFAGEPPLLRYMHETPIKRKEPVLCRSMTRQILSMGGYNLVLCIIFLSSEFFRNKFGYYTDYNAFMTAFFALFVFGGVFGALCARSDRVNIFSGILRSRAFIAVFALIMTVQIVLVYFGGRVFRTTYIPPAQLTSVLAIAFSVVPFEIIRKILFKTFKKH